jgi:hypothetical protein
MPAFCFATCRSRPNEVSVGGPTGGAKKRAEIESEVQWKLGKVLKEPAAMLAFFICVGSLVTESSEGDNPTGGELIIKG